MGKSLLYAANTTSQTVSSTGTVLNFGTIVRKRGCNANLSGGNIVLSGVGYYNVYVNLTFTSSAAGTEQFQVYKDGTVIPGATASLTVAEGSTYAVCIPCIIRDTCCCESTLTASVSGVSGTVNNASVMVK